jgi:hypothetical protein
VSSRAPMEDGIGPARALSYKYKRCNDLRSPMVDGIGPVRVFKYNAVEMGPVRAFADRNKYYKDFLSTRNCPRLARTSDALWSMGWVLSERLSTKSYTARIADSRWSKEGAPSVRSNTMPTPSARSDCQSKMGCGSGGCYWPILVFARPSSRRSPMDPTHEIIGGQLHGHHMTESFHTLHAILHTDCRSTESRRQSSGCLSNWRGGRANC